MKAKHALGRVAAALCLLALAGAPAIAEAPLKAAPGEGPLVVRVGEAKDISHIEFHWQGGARMTTRRDGQKLIVAFSRNARPDLTRLTVNPPKFLKSTDVSSAGGGGASARWNRLM